MAVFRARIVKQHSTKLIKWENRYYVKAESLEAAHGNVTTFLAEMEAAIHNASINIIQAITSDLPEGGDFISSPLSLIGLNGVSGDELPGILTLNAVFNKMGFGLPDRKYYHVFWGETGQAGGVWSETPLAAADTALNEGVFNMSHGSTPLCDIEGDEWLSALALSQVGSHKFSKRSKRAVS